MLRLLSRLFGARSRPPSESPAEPDPAGGGEPASMADVLAYGDVDETLALVAQVFQDTGGALRIEQAEALKAGLDRLLPDLEDLADPRLASAWMLQGQCLEAMGHLHEAVTAYGRSRKLDPALGGQARAEQLRQDIRETEDTD